MSNKETGRLVSIANIASKDEYIPPKILRFMLQSCARELLPDERVAECLRKIIPTRTNVEIHKSPSKKTAHYRNLVVCSRVWHCPVCAATISEERRKELHTATMAWTGGLALVTYTASHRRGQALKVILNALLASYRDFKSGRVFQEIIEFYGWAGSVRSLEITYGENGWHPHIHELVFFTNPIPERQFGHAETQLRSRWIQVLKKNHLFASNERGLTLKDANQDISDYVAKFGGEKVGKNWTVAHELAKQVVKKGSYGGRTPTQLLYDYLFGDVQAGKLWQEYAHTLKGKNQMVWSRGMRAMLKMLPEVSDEVLSETLPDDAVVLATLSRGEWSAILAMESVGRVLHEAEIRTNDDFNFWLDDLLKGYFSGNVK